MKRVQSKGDIRRYFYQRKYLQRLTIGSHVHYYHFRMVLPLAGQLPMLYSPQQLLYSIACGAAQLHQGILQDKYWKIQHLGESS